ncbi:unnamed protein product, partial [Pylaiella littoralis]
VHCFSKSVPLDDRLSGNPQVLYFRVVLYSRGQMIVPVYRVSILVETGGKQPPQQAAVYRVGCETIGPVSSAGSFVHDRLTVKATGDSQHIVCCRQQPFPV